MNQPPDPPLDLPAGSEDEAILAILHGIRAHPTAAALLETLQELGALRMDWAAQAATIAAMQERIGRLQGAVARLSRSLAEERGLPPPEAEPPAAPDAG